ncbi:MAG: Wzt carbohydrate-binding domain-containing protein [Desulfobacterales bacterium]
MSEIIIFRKMMSRPMHFKEIGKTILLCSHSQYHVGELCERAIWLEKGRIRKDDAAPEVLSEYIAYLENRQYEKRSGMSHPESNLSHPPEVIVEKIFLTDREGAVLNQIEKFQTVVLKIQTRTSGEPFTGHMGVAIKKPDTQVIFATTTKESGQEAIRFSGRQTIEFVMPSIPLMSGAYQMGAVVTDIHALHPIHDNLSGIITVTSRRPELGMYWIDHKWRLPSSATA